MSIWLRRSSRVPRPPKPEDRQIGLHADENGQLWIVDESGLRAVGSSEGGEHPNLATHTAMGLAAEHEHDYAAPDHAHDTTHTHDTYATDSDLTTHAGTAHGLSSHAIDGAFHSGTNVLPSAGQKNALAGTSGTPGDANRYVTDQDARLSDDRDPTAHSHDYSASNHTHTLTDPDIPASIARDLEITAAIATHAATPHGGEGGGFEFPIGYVVITVIDENPGTGLGYGTWSRIAQGRFLVGVDAGSAEEQAGSATHTHAAHTGVINHTHPVTDPGHAHVETSNNATTGPLRGWGAADTSTNTETATGYSTASATTGVTTANPAGGVASLTHDSASNLPPSLSVYVWKRTA